MHPLAAAGSSVSDDFWTYLGIFGLVTLGWAGIPGIGATVLGAATVAASQGKLNIAAVLIVAIIAVEVGGLVGYSVGVRWGRELLSHPGPLLARRQGILTAGEAMYVKWGRLAVFFTPCMVSGIARMKYSQFVVWNFLAGAAYVISVGFSVYGAGKVATGHHDAVSVGSLVVGIAVGVTVFLFGRRYYRRRKARRAGALGGRGGATPAPAAADEEN
jgi:membrane protein DedA with SNARE-associated domain